MINYDDAERALEYRKATDIEVARLKCLYKGKERLLKSVLAAEYEKHEGSNTDRMQKALASQVYESYVFELEKAQLDWETMENKRESAALQIEMWRSVNSNQRKGNI